MGLLGSHTHTNTHTVTLTLCRLITVIAHTVFPALCLRVFQFFSVFSVFRFWNRARRRLQLRSRPGHGARARKKRIKKAQTDCRWSEESTGGGSTESWSNYKTGSGCSCSRSSRVSLCARERETGRLVGLERESCYGLLGNSRNENSARLIIFTYCKTPSRLYRIERALITFRLCF